MKPLFAGLLIGLFVIVIFRRLRLNAIERKLADERESTHEASTYLIFVRELKNIAADPTRAAAMLEEIVALLTKAAGATSGAFFKLARGGTLERVVVVGAHPTQVVNEGATITRAAGVAASMGDESVRVDQGVVGRAAHDRRTAVVVPHEREFARLAVPVSNAAGVAGVVSIAGPCSGGPFAPRGVALIERLVAAAQPALLHASGAA